MLPVLAGDWSLPSDAAVVGVHHGYRQIPVVSNRQLREPSLAGVLTEKQPVWAAWLSRIEPGGYIVEHIDAGPHRERWQYPFTVCPIVQDGKRVDHPPGVWFRVHHDRWHSVPELDEERVTLVVDRDVIVNPVRSPLKAKV